MITGAILADGFGYGHMTGVGWWGWGMMLFWIVVVVALVYSFTRSIQPQRSQDLDAQPSPQDPFAVLADRYARGEIDSAEYRTRRETLRG